jgi:hypothetical protein
MCVHVCGCLGLCLKLQGVPAWTTRTAGGALARRDEGGQNHQDDQGSSSRASGSPHDDKQVGALGNMSGTPRSQKTRRES